MIICPTVEYLNFENGDEFTFRVQVGSRFLGWTEGGMGRWGFVTYGRPNGAPLDYEPWIAYRAQANHFITTLGEGIFLGVSRHDSSFLFLSTKER